MEDGDPMPRVPIAPPGSPPYPALIIAKWFIAWAEAEADELSNLKLQKLLYYSQGHYLAEYDIALFSEPIQAWSHGPVVPKVYYEYKDSGSSSIRLQDSDPFEWNDVDPGTADFLSKVWNTYGGYSAGWLRNMTHEEKPWKDHWRDGEVGNQIPREEIREFFSREMQHR
jgi:uncharacterized phage-associated protein